ncbi:1,2-phenylacetyl-CoA epoxidase subunit PaaC [Haloferacaceae archaeon DSL9]
MNRLGPTDLDDAQRAAVEELLFQLADDEYVIAERYIEWQIFAPTLESDLALSNIAQDEFGHARLWYDLLTDLGYTEQELIWERPADEWQHATLVEQPFAEGDWADAVVRSYLYDTAERLRLEAIANTSYAPLADRVEKAQLEERYHLEHAQSWLERLAATDHDDRVQRALNRLFPYALTLFEPGEREETIRELGLRTESLSALREEWLDEVIPYLESLDFEVPEPADATPPGALGRDKNHTDAWVDLYEDFTRTYDELDRPEPVRLRGEKA